jgi:hypothetical protein
MAILTDAILAVWNDVEPMREAAFNDWYVKDHLPDRLAIPGFRRGRRWLSTGGRPRYFTFYEIDAVDVMHSPAYLARHARPTAWTCAVMPSFIGMNRSVCRVTARHGSGDGGVAAVVRLTPAAGAEARLRDWIVGEALPASAGCRESFQRVSGRSTRRPAGRAAQQKRVSAKAPTPRSTGLSSSKRRARRRPFGQAALSARGVPPPRVRPPRERSKPIACCAALGRVSSLTIRWLACLSPLVRAPAGEARTVVVLPNHRSTVQRIACRLMLEFDPSPHRDRGLRASGGEGQRF